VVISIIKLACLPEAGAKRQRCIEQEDDNQSKITFEGIYVIDDFGPIIPTLSGDIDPMEADLHSRESIALCGS
jgi:hypothetical protein